MKLLPLFLVGLLATSAHAGTNGVLIVETLDGRYITGTVQGVVGDDLVINPVIGSAQVIPVRDVTLATLEKVDRAPKNDAEWRQRVSDLEARIKTLASRRTAQAVPAKPVPPPQSQKAAVPAEDPIVPGKLNILKAGSRLVEKSDHYSHVSWKVDLYNATQSDLIVRVTMKFLDAEGFKLEEGVVYRFPIKAGEKTTATDKIMVSNDVWARVKSYEVLTKLD